MTAEPDSDNQAQLLAGVLDSALDGIMALRAVRDPTGAITDFTFQLVNRSAEQIVQREASELLGQSLLEVFPGNRTDGLFDAYVKVVETDQPYHTVHLYQHDGLNLWFNIKATRWGDGFTVTFSDITEHKAVDERFEALFESSIDAHLLYDDTGILDCNQAAVELLGYTSKDELLGKHPADLSPAMQPGGIRSADKRVMLSGQLAEKGLSRFDWVHLRQDGSELPVEVLLRKVRLAGGEAVLAVWHDLSERVKAEQKCHDTAARLTEAQELSSIGNWEWIPENNRIVWSAQTKKMFGVPLDQPAPDFQTHEQQIHPDDLPHWRSVVNRALEDHQPYVMRFRALLPGGRVRTIEGRGRCELGADGQMVRLFGTVQDITERVAAEAAVNEHRRRLEFALDMSCTGLWDWDTQGGSVYFSDTWYTMLGYEPGELPMTYETWASLAHPEDLPKAVSALQAYSEGRSRQYACEMRMRNKAGQWQWIKTVGETIKRDSTGNVTRIIGLHLDIHAQKLAQDEIAAARDLAQQASTAKSAFVANMSHEIRTPMTAILGYADLLLEPGQSPADKHNHVQTIRRNGRHLMAILNDVLDVSKIEAGKMTIERVTCAPEQLLHDIIQMMTPRAQTQGIDLELACLSPLPAQIRTDPTRLRQVLLNLVGNAIKFTPQGSVRVEVATSPGPQGEIELTCAVIDTGIGIDPQQIDWLFKPFNQADDSTTRNFGGTGLGLTISQKLCRLMGGDLACDSEPGRGSTFTAHVVVGRADEPVPAKPAPTASASASDEAPEPLVGRRVLVVEDGPDNQRLIKHYLTKAGAHVEVADNGAIGRDRAEQALAEQQPFDIVLMDMQMPVLDGYSATRALRDAGYTRPILALTAHASANDRAACLDAGCDDYLTKPIDRQQLVQAVLASLCPHAAKRDSLSLPITR